MQKRLTIAPIRTDPRRARESVRKLLRLDPAKLLTVLAIVSVAGCTRTRSAQVYPDKAERSAAPTLSQPTEHEPADDVDAYFAHRQRVSVLACEQYASCKNPNVRDTLFRGALLFAPELAASHKSLAEVSGAQMSETERRHVATLESMRRSDEEPTAAQCEALVYWVSLMNEPERYVLRLAVDRGAASFDQGRAEECESAVSKGLSTCHAADATPEQLRAELSELAQTCDLFDESVAHENFPQVGFGSLVIAGPLALQLIRPVVYRHRTELDRCIGRDSPHNELLLQFTIGAAGEVSGATLGPDHLEPALAECVLAVVRQWVFPASKQATSVECKLYPN